MKRFGCRHEYYWMMIILSAVEWARLVNASASSSASFRPPTFSMNSLVSESNSNNNDDKLENALRDIGMIIVNDIPGYVEQKRNVWKWFSSCQEDLHNDSIMSSSDSKGSSRNTLIHTFPDGTIRKTIATSSNNKNHNHPKLSFHDNDKTMTSFSSSSSKACFEFQKSSHELQTIIDHVMALFTQEVSKIITSHNSNDNDKQSLLYRTKQQDNDNKNDIKTNNVYSTFQQVMDQAEYLEHFHMYEKAADSQQQKQDHQNTVDMHTDLGLFLVFTPGQLVLTTKNNNNKKNDKKEEQSIVTNDMIGTFQIQLQPNDKSPMSVVSVDFQQDDLVFMMGHALQQLNPHLFRAVPHSLQISSSTPHNSNSNSLPNRAWYGRMVLSPSDAILTSADDPHNDLTFSQFRQNLQQQQDNDNTIMTIGCSSSTTTRTTDDNSSAMTKTRLLAVKAEDCTDNQLFCWHKCFNITIPSKSDCTDQDTNLKCVDLDTNQLWDKDDPAHKPKSKPMCFPLKVTPKTDTPSSAPPANTSSAIINHIFITTTVFLPLLLFTTTFFI